MKSFVYKRILIQIIKEFWIQILISILWILSADIITQKPSIIIIINHFFSAFFLSSWIIGQFIRIAKQQKTEDNFHHIKNELQILLNNIQEQTKHLIGYATGGSSVGYFIPLLIEKNFLTFGFINETDYPVFDASIEWIDLDENINPPQGIYWTRHRINVGTVHPHKIIKEVFSFDMSQRNRLRINIFIFTRNKNISQQVRVEKIKNNLKIAVKTTFENFEKIDIPNDFPGYNPQQPEKIFY